MITVKVKIYKSIKCRTIGLIGHDNPEPIMFYTKFGIHTFGLKFPIDVLILDKNNEAPQPHGRGIFSQRFVGSGIPPKRKLLRYTHGLEARGIREGG